MTSIITPWTHPDPEHRLDSTRLAESALDQALSAFVIWSSFEIFLKKQKCTVTSWRLTLSSFPGDRKGTHWQVALRRLRLCCLNSAMSALTKEK